MAVKNTNKLLKNKYAYSVGLGLATVLIVILAVFLLILPFYSKAKKLTTENKTKKQELTYLTDKKAKLEKLINREDELKQKAELVRNALPESKDVGRLFIQLDELARENKGIIKSIVEGGAINQAVSLQTNIVGVEKNSYSVPIEFNNYFDYMNFIEKAENALRLINIDRVSIKAKDSGEISVSLTTTAYSRSK
jgi:Tfp pilus assembly protein PilO